MTFSLNECYDSWIRAISMEIIDSLNELSTGILSDLSADSL